MQFATRLRQERLRRHLSQEMLAEALGVSPRTISRWERGQAIPQATVRIQLSRYLELPPNVLFGEDEILPDLSQAEEQVLDQSGEISFPSPVAPESLPAHTIVSGDLPQKEWNLNTTTSTPRRYRRRGILLGLGGAGLTALAAGGLWFALHYNPASAHPSLSRPPSPTPMALNRRLHHLYDPTVSNWINHLAWSPDGSLLAAASGLNAVDIWNIQKEVITLSYPTLNGWVNDVSWSQSNWIAAATADLHAGSLQIWKFPEKAPMLTLRKPYALRSVCWSPDGRYLAISGHSPTVEVWNPFIATQINHYTDSTLGLLGITRVKWSPSGHLLACAADDGTVHVWEALTGISHIIYRDHKSSVHDLSWSPDERFIVSGGDDKTGRVWEVSNGRTVAAYRGHAATIEGVGWSPSGTYVASASADRTAHIWIPSTGRLIALYGGHHSIVETPLWSADGTRLAIGTEEEGIEVWQAPHV